MKQILIYGEVLFDLFPNGESVLGGAPFNVAWHLCGFGCKPLFVSAVGNDELGEKVLREMNNWGLDTAGVYVHPALPTGRVTVSFDNGQPQYTINDNQAYDAVPGSHLKELLRDRSFDLIYHGSLALRSAEAQQNFDDYLLHEKTRRLVDINLRSPWWDRDSALRLIQGAELLKINDEELDLLSGTQQADLRGQTAEFIKRNDLGALVLTRGKLGAAYSDRSGVFCQTPIIDDGAVPFVDSVGAGDAFCSVCLLGMLDAWHPQTILERASSFATRICRLRGATTTDLAVYREAQETWGNDYRR